MASPELQESWRRTTAYLRDARSHLSEAAEGICADEIAQFEEYLDHNELGLALAALEEAVFKSGLETLRVLELMILAAQNMKLEERVARYRAAIEGAHRATEDRWKKRET